MRIRRSLSSRGPAAQSVGPAARTLFTVASLARHAGLEAQVVRYYARLGLVQPLTVSQNGYRRFDASDVRRLRFIKAAQRLGFTLAEIGEVLRRSQRREARCPWVRDILCRRLTERAADIAAMNRQLAHMQGALASWRRMPDSLPTGSDICGLIEAIADLEPTPDPVGYRDG